MDEYNIGDRVIVNRKMWYGETGRPGPENPTRHGQGSEQEQTIIVTIERILGEHKFLCVDDSSGISGILYEGEFSLAPKVFPYSRREIRLALMSIVGRLLFHEMEIANVSLEHQLQLAVEICFIKKMEGIDVDIIRNAIEHHANGDGLPLE